MLNAYTGRFAPTPSGPLHFGSLVAALGSYLDAKAHQGKWLLRIEDVDRSRSRQPFIDIILQQLEALHLYWDGQVKIQSQHIDNYQQALSQLTAHLYPCNCSRRQWHSHAQSGVLGKVYPGFCREKPFTTLNPLNAALRLKMPNQLICFSDRLLGEHCFHGLTDIGDPILKRRDGDIAYALAVVIDDALQGVTDVVRGQDLLATTVIQRYLQECLHLPNVRYLHLPLVTNSIGHKLSKQNHAPAINTQKPNLLIYQALKFLGQPVDDKMLSISIDELLQIAIKQWNIDSIAHNAQILEQTLNNQLTVNL